MHTVKNTAIRISHLKAASSSQAIVQEYLGMTITFFNIETTEKGDVRMIIQVK